MQHLLEQPNLHALVLNTVQLLIDRFAVIVFKAVNIDSNVRAFLFKRFVKVLMLW